LHRAASAEEGQHRAPCQAGYWSSPASYPDRSGDLRSVIKVSDFYSPRQWHSTGMYRDACRPYGIEHELMLCLPAGRPRQDRRVRADPAADLVPRARPGLLRPRPRSAHRAAPQLHQAYLDAERRRHPVPRLTARHWDLLHLVAAGHTNAQIARRLGISEGTVRTHLEHIYRLLQVSSRNAAVTRAVIDPTGLTPRIPGPGRREPGRVLPELARALRLPHRPGTTLPLMICRLWRGWAKTACTVEGARPSRKPIRARPSRPGLTQRGITVDHEDLPGIACRLW
jgi:DNA-binding CsgD family transcriptional regulator